MAWVIVDESNNAETLCRPVGARAVTQLCVTITQARNSRRRMSRHLARRREAIVTVTRREDVRVSGSIVNESGKRMTVGVQTAARPRKSQHRGIDDPSGYRDVIGRHRGPQ